VDVQHTWWSDALDFGNLIKIIHLIFNQILEWVASPWGGRRRRRHTEIISAENKRRRRGDTGDACSTRQKRRLKRRQRMKVHLI